MIPLAQRSGLCYTKEEEAAVVSGGAHPSGNRVKPLFCDAADAECRNAQQKPQTGERQADLTVQVQRHAAVVPDVPAHDEIVCDTHGKFQGSDEYCAAPILQQQSPGRCSSMDQVEPHCGGTAGERHGPVGIAPANNFQQTIDKSPQQKEPAEFTGLVMQFQEITSFFLLPVVCAEMQKIYRSRLPRNDRRSCIKKAVCDM